MGQVRSLFDRLARRRQDPLIHDGFVCLGRVLSADQVAAVLAGDLGVVDRLRPALARHLGVDPSAIDVVSSAIETAEPGDIASGRPVAACTARGLDGASKWLLWIALDDVTGHNAQLRVLPRTARPSAPVSRALEGHRGEVERWFTDLPLPAGDAVLIEGAILRAVHANHTDQPRRALAVTVRIPRAEGQEVPQPATGPLEAGVTEAMALPPSGYQRLRLLDEDATEAVRRTIDAAVAPPRDEFYVSRRDDCGEVAGGLDLQLKELLTPAVRAIFPGHRILFAAACSKPPGPSGEVMFHHDLTCTDERTHRAQFVWLPLVDTDRWNGGLEVVPGSHRWTTGIRPELAANRVVATEAHQGRFRERAVEVPLWAGDAVVFDAALLHGSGPNRSTQARMAVTFVVVPEDATIVHFHADADGQVSGHLVDDGFFTRHAFAQAPNGYAQIEPWAAPVTSDDFERALADTEPAARS